MSELDCRAGGWGVYRNLGMTRARKWCCRRMSCMGVVCFCVCVCVCVGVCVGVCVCVLVCVCWCVCVCCIYITKITILSCV